MKADQSVFQFWEIAQLISPIDFKPIDRSSLGVLVQACAWKTFVFGNAFQMRAYFSFVCFGLNVGFEFKSQFPNEIEQECDWFEICNL